MATVLEKSTLRVFESVNTPDYPETDFIINPDLSAVSGVPQKYWALKEGAVLPLTKEEQTTKDVALIAELETKIPPCPYGHCEKCEYIPL